MLPVLCLCGELASALAWLRWRCVKMQLCAHTSLFRHPPHSGKWANDRVVCGLSRVCVGQVAVRFATLPTARVARMAFALVLPPGQPCACATVRRVALVFRRFFGQY